MGDQDLDQNLDKTVKTLPDHESLSVYMNVNKNCGPRQSPKLREQRHEALEDGNNDHLNMNHAPSNPPSLAHVPVETNSNHEEKLSEKSRNDKKCCNIL